MQGKIGSSVACPSTIDDLEERDMIAKIHTHVGYIQEHGASGDYIEPSPYVITDKYNYENMLRRANSQHFKIPRHYVYEVPYRTLYQYDEKRGNYYRGKYNETIFKKVL